MAKVSCILHHRGVQLILAYSWARLAILVAGRVQLINSGMKGLNAILVRNLLENIKAG